MGIPANGEADYPFLAANIVNKTTLERMPWTLPYLIKEYGDLRVGVIGLIGDVISSISVSLVSEYTFLDVVDQAAYWAHYLRTIELVDIVVVSIHGYNTYDNSEIAALRGDYRVDAILTGHTHSNVSELISRTGAPLPVIQTNASGSKLVGKITLTYDHATQSVTQATAAIIGSTSFGSESAAVRAVLTTFSADATFIQYVGEVLTSVTAYSSTASLARWGASVIRDYMNVDVGVLNSGGFRKGIPVGNLTMGFLVEVYPFDNYIKTVHMTGAMLIHLKTTSSLIFDDRFDVNQIDPQRIYSVGAVDYVFDQAQYNFLQGSNIQLTTFLMRDLLVNDLRNSDGTFNPTEGSNYPN
ncbi:MAG: 5'-nucleotidase C-terminal domain-containing protein [Bacillus subtilis]|nr:5'-nucleotidase C-terminal domain-containing protein [Bacillus subtilis]